MKLVIDSNVYFSAFTGRGLCSDLVDWCLEHHDVFVSEEILNEVCVNLRKRSKVTPYVIEEARMALRAEGTCLRPLEVERGVVRDDGDRHILGLAMAAKANLMITGDQDLLVLGRFKGIPILSPRDAWLQLRMG